MINYYRQLAQELDKLPNGFPATEEGLELKLLAKLFSPEETHYAAQLHTELETAEQIAIRTGDDPLKIKNTLKGLARRGLVACAKTDQGLGFGLMPFVVGFYEMQVSKMDQELAFLFEAYYQKAAYKLFAIEPQFHRVVPVIESIPKDLSVQPFESVNNILSQAKSWGVTECICRKQKALIGEPCEHPLDVCMVLNPKPDMFVGNLVIRNLSFQEAQSTLHKAAEAGLVHSVSNQQEGNWYICNCCTCSCGILRGMAELGLANVVAHSNYVNSIDQTKCTGCESCLQYCQFGALEMNITARVDIKRCVGCGLCVTHCEDEAMELVLRSGLDGTMPPKDETTWKMIRAKNRNI